MFGGRPRSVWAGVLVALLSLSGLPGFAAATAAGQTATPAKPAVEAPRPALNCPEVPPSGVGGRPPVGEMKVRVAVDAQTQWRPRRQAVIFTVAGVDFEANVGLFCTYFRWKDDPQPANVWRRTPWQLVAKPSSDETQFSVAVPYDLPNPPAGPFERMSGSSKIGDSTAIGLVPVADFRVIAFAKDGATAANPEVFDSTRDVGVTDEHSAFFITLVVMIGAWGLLYLFGRWRGVPGQSDPFLQLISTQAGVASLSQLQILLWTFVIGGSAVYVMILSGNLIPVTKGMLVLLGISGGAILGSNLDAKRQTSGGAAAATTLAVPGEISGLRINGTPDESDVRLWWAVASGSVTDSYKVRYQRTDGVPLADWVTWTQTLTRPGQIISGLDADAPYEFQVCASNSSGDGPWAKTSGRTGPALLNAGPRMTGLRLTALVSNSSLQVVWDPVADAAAYEVQYRRHDGDEPWARPVVGANMANIVGLAANTAYDVRVAVSLGRPTVFANWTMILAITGGPRVPLWSDLIISRDRGHEIDVTRVQMLFFTVIVAFFVGLRVLTSSTIPEIPDGFLYLMGISNSVYVTSKFIS